MLAVEMDGKPQNMNFAKVDWRGGATNREVALIRINTVIPYLVYRCICPAPCWSRQTLEKNVLSWALAGTGCVPFTHQVVV